MSTQIEWKTGIPPKKDRYLCTTTDPEYPLQIMDFFPAYTDERTCYKSNAFWRTTVFGGGGKAMKLCYVIAWGECPETYKPEPYKG